MFVLFSHFNIDFFYFSILFERFLLWPKYPNINCFHYFAKNLSYVYFKTLNFMFKLFEVNAFITGLHQINGHVECRLHFCWNDFKQANLSWTELSWSSKIRNSVDHLKVLLGPLSYGPITWCEILIWYSNSLFVLVQNKGESPNWKVKDIFFIFRSLKYKRF